MEKVAVLTAGNLASGALKINRQKPLTDRLLKKALEYNMVKDQIFNKAKAQVMKQTNGLYPAPLKVLCCLIINSLLLGSSSLTLFTPTRIFLDLRSFTDDLG